MSINLTPPKRTNVNINSKTNTISISNGRLKPINIVTSGVNFHTVGDGITEQRAEEIAEEAADDSTGYDPLAYYILAKGT